MALISCLFSFKILTISVILFLSLPCGANGIPERELEAMLSVLRSRGYNLFGNAILTSDIHYDIIAGTSFTFFAPTDSALFALDMIATASDYIQTLRYHVVVQRFSLANIRSLPPGSSLRTLLHRHDINISSRPSPESLIFTADGVDIVLTGIYYGRDIAVHGLSGALSLRSLMRLRDPSPRCNFSGNDGFSPSTDDTSLSPSAEPCSDGISPTSSLEYQDLSPAHQETMISNSQDILLPEYGFPLNPSDPAYTDVFPPIKSMLSEYPLISTEDGLICVPPTLIDNTLSDSDGNSKKAQPEVMTPEKNSISLRAVDESKEERPTDSEVTGDNPALKPMMPPLKEEQTELPAILPELFCPLDAENMDCPDTDGHSYLLQHYSDYTL